MEIIAFGYPIVTVEEVISPVDLGFIKDAAYSIYNKTTGDQHNFMCDLWCSFNQTDLLGDYRFSHLIGNVTHYVNEYSRSIGGLKYTQPTEAWLNIYGQGHHQEAHGHLGSLFSAVYYLDAPEGSSPLCFYGPSPYNIEFDSEDWSPMKDRFMVQPKSNSLVIFPSQLTHSVPVNKNTELRSSIALNFVQSDQWL